jgi:hypothetical protein
MQLALVKGKSTAGQKNNETEKLDENGNKIL